MSKKCLYEELVSGRICRVKYCADCGVVHLILGAMTLNLSSDQFEQLAQSLQQASQRKREIDSPPAVESRSGDVVLRFPGVPFDKP